MSPELNLKRAVFVLGKIDEILAWEKDRVRERDLCFVEQIHHIQFRSQMGSDNCEWNLITLCPRCHQEAHRNNNRGLRV